jgi:hypothetical protein
MLANVNTLSPVVRILMRKRHRQETQTEGPLH